MKHTAEKIKKIVEMMSGQPKRDTVVAFDTSNLMKQMQGDHERMMAEMESKMAQRMDSMVYEYMEHIGNTIEKIRKEKGERGEPGLDGRDGQDVDEERVAKMVLRNIRLPRDGKDADEFTVENKVLDKVLKRIPVPKNGTDGSPDSPEQIKTKLESIGVDLKKEEDLEKYVRDLIATTKVVGGGGGGGRNNIKYHDLSSLCDGSAKTFAIPSNKLILGVYSTQFPINYRPIVDWTGSGTTTLTLTGEVGAPATGQTLYILYVE